MKERFLTKESLIHLRIFDDTYDLYCGLVEIYNASYTILHELSLIDQAAHLNVKLAFENLRALEHLHAIFDSEDASRAGMCYDIGHNHCYTHDDSLLARYSDRILAVHLHDNDGCTDRHLIPFDGTIDWKSEMETLGKSSYQGSITLEISGYAQEPLEERMHRASMAADRLIALSKRE